MGSILYTLFIALIVALLSVFFQLFKVKVWINCKTKRDSRLTTIGRMKYSGNQIVPEVHLIGRSKSPAIGRIKMGEDDDDNAYVEILINDINDDSVKPEYRTYGYISQDGYIYKINQKNKPEKIGYTAKPSNPNTPTVVGERTWKTLWLKCSLNVYMGKPSEKGKKKEPSSKCYHLSFHSSKKDAMPPEARAAAFALIFSLFNKKNYSEYYNTPAYGWKDTALLASFVYTILYIIWLLINQYILIDTDYYVNIHLEEYLSFYGIYFALWAIVRAIKIECIENSNTIQPKLDLFNKSLGQKFFDICILICCIIILFPIGQYGYNFKALALAIATGVIVNMLLQSSSQRWEIKNPFVVEEEKEDQEQPVNPEGDIVRNYKWLLDSENVKDVEGDLTLYFDAHYISGLRFENPFYNQRQDKPTKIMILDMFNYMKEHHGITARTRYIVSQIKNIAAQNALSIEDTLQFTLDFVQEPNIRFSLNRDSKAINQYDNYIRFPDEVLFDKEADSNSKALLAAMLFHFMSYNVLYLFSRKQHHSAIGIEVNDEWIDNGYIFGKKVDEITIIHNNKRYIFCETTSDGFRIGGTMEGMRYDDFEEHIELPLFDDDVNESNEDTITCVYNWTLDSELGSQLDGSYTLEFSTVEIQDLRQLNPFRTYGKEGDQNSYGDNIRLIFDYLAKDPEHTKYVKEIASYIKQRIAEQNLGELDLVQFALDFCQEPNIKYCVDESSKGINYAKEYMRFPDEVLFDKEGDCDCKSSLTAALFRELGYNVIIMLSSKLQHAGIGIECKDEWIEQIKPENPESVVKEYNNKKYLYCETTGDGYRIGHIEASQSIQDFETIVEINV